MLVVSAAKDPSLKSTITHLNVVVVTVSDACAWVHVRAGALFTIFLLMTEAPAEEADEIPQLHLGSPSVWPPSPPLWVSSPRGRCLQ